MDSSYYQQFLNKKIKIFFDDGQTVNRREGILKNFDDNYIVVGMPDKEEAIPVSKLIRIEFLEGENV